MIYSFGINSDLRMYPNLIPYTNSDFQVTEIQKPKILQCQLETDPVHRGSGNGLFRT